MKVNITITAVIFFQLMFLTGLAQNDDLKFNPVEGPDGKPLGKINAITQDPHGYIWLCGHDENCIYRYDGNRMISFGNDEANTNSLGFDSPETVYADDKGMIWIGGKGLDQYNPATGIFKHYRHLKNDSGSLAGFVTVILKDHLGQLWLGTAIGLDRFDEKTGKFFHYRNEPGNPRSLSCNDVRAIYEDHTGVIWVGTGFPFFPPGKPNFSGGLNRLNPDGTFTRYLHDPNNPHSLINNKVRAIFEDSRGVFWVGTSGDGLHTMDREKGTFQRHLYNPAKPGELSRPPVKNEADHITFINEDSSGAIWIGSYAAGINRYDPITKKITHYQSGNGFSDSTCWNDCISRDGVLWISTEDSKLLYRVDPFHKSIHSITTVTDAITFLEDKKGYLWVATERNGLLKYDQQKNLIKQYKNEPSNPFSLFDDELLSLFQNQEDTIWVGTSHGLRILNTVTGKFFRFPDAGNLKDTARDGAISDIFQDKQGFMWFGRLGMGLVRYNPKDHSFKHFLSDAKDSTSISSNIISTILEDTSGVLWVGSFQGGINRFNGETGRFKHYLDGSDILCLYKDPEGNLWAGTNKGFFCYNRNQDKFISFFDPSNEINSLRIVGMIEDTSKDLWLRSQSAIIRLNPVTKETFIYGGRFGIIPGSMEFIGGIYKNNQGQLYIGHVNGFYILSPRDLALRTDFKINLTDFFINTLPVLPGKGRPLQKPVEDISNIDLRYNQNNIAFNFSATDYRQPEATKYFTMLENYDNTWREAAGEKSSFYFNISPGKYVYRVRAFNIDGTKSEKTITINITPPWWESWLFKVSAIIFIGVTFYGLIRWRLKQKFRRQFERSEKEREMAELKQKGTELEMQALRAQMNPHFIFNSLNSINRFILQNNKAQASEYLIKFSKLVRLILQNSQASLITLDSELESLELYLSLETLRFNYHFDYKITIPNDMDISALQVPPLILQPYVENAIWHGLMHKEEKGQLNVEVSEEDNYLYFTITDNGIGREQAAVLASKSATKHKSMGLQITAHRIAIIQKSQPFKSPVTINDLLNEDGSSAGTRVTIKMPVLYDQ